MAIDKKELSRLSPGERLKKLKTLEEDSKKEVDEIGQLIRDSLKELKTGKLAEEITPEQKPVDISSLFEASKGLEKKANSETGTKGKGDYQAFIQAYQDYSSLKKMMHYAASSGLMEEQIQIIDKIGERLDKTKYETVSAEIANIIVASRAALHKIKKYSGL